MWKGSVACLMNTVIPSGLLLGSACAGAQENDFLVLDDVVCVQLKKMGPEHPFQIRPDWIVALPEVSPFRSSTLHTLERVPHPHCTMYTSIGLALIPFCLRLQSQWGPFTYLSALFYIFDSIKCRWICATDTFRQCTNRKVHWACSL